MAHAVVPSTIINGACLQMPPGFHFRPTDDELVMQYLHRRSVSMPLPCAIIVDAAESLRCNPWDLVPEGAEEKFFFERKGTKYLTGRRRTNRATSEGYWKSAAKEVPIHSRVAGGKPVLVGMKRRLAFYCGKKPSGERTHWIMHEYRLAGAGLTPFRVVRSVITSSSRNTTNAIIDSSKTPSPAVAKKNAARARARVRAALASTRPVVPAMVCPDDSWVLCRIIKKEEGSNSAAGTSEVRVPALIDFLGQADRDASNLSSCVTTDSSSDKEDGDRATD